MRATVGIMTHIVSLAAVILASSLLRWRAAEATVLCAWTKVSSNQEVHHSFLRAVRRDPPRSSPSLRLYHSAWSAGERALLRCAWSDDAAVVGEYLSACRQRTDEFSDRPDASLNAESLLLETDARCVSLTSPSVAERRGRRPARSAGAAPPDGSERESRRRVKRGFIVPGTLWCGSGNKALSYEDLGKFHLIPYCYYKTTLLWGHNLHQGSVRQHQWEGPACDQNKSQ